MVMTELVRHIACALVAHPEAVDVKVDEDERRISVVLKVASDDMGRIIGKHGRIANALRTVLKSYGARRSKKVYVEIID